MFREFLKNHFISVSLGILSRSNTNLFFSKKIVDLLFYLHLDKVKKHFKEFFGKQYAFDHNALWSFPRSGNHWVRFITEYLSDCPTHGCTTNLKDVPIYLNTFPSAEHPLIHVNPKNPFILYKSHFPYATTSVSSIILLIRNYHDHLSGLPEYVMYGEKNSKIRFLHETITYLELINWYDRFSGNKMVIYYEDLLTCPEREISRIRYFLNGSHERYMAFMENYDYYAELSKQGKNRDWLHNNKYVLNMKNQKKLTKQDMTARENILRAFLATKRYQSIKPYLARYG